MKALILYHCGDRIAAYDMDEKLAHHLRWYLNRCAKYRGLEYVNEITIEVEQPPIFQELAQDEIGSLES